MFIPRIPLLLMVAVLVLGCGQVPTTKDDGKTSRNSSKPSDKRKTIGVSLLTLENPFFRVIGDNITSAGKEHGYDSIVVSADKDAAKQANQVKDFIVKKVAAIVISPCESRSMVPVIQEANAAGIPVFTVDIPCREPNVKIVSQIATDNLGGGREAATAMIEAIGDKGGKIAILHFKQAESCRLRVQGFREIIDQYNQKSAKKLDIVMELEAGGAKDTGYKAAEDALQAHGDLSGIFAINDPSALGARAAMEKAGRTSIILIGFDGQPEGKQAIKEGKIYADPVQFPDRMGIEVVQAIVKYYRGDDVPAENLIPTSLYRKADAEKDNTLR